MFRVKCSMFYSSLKWFVSSVLGTEQSIIASQVVMNVGKEITTDMIEEK